MKNSITISCCILLLFCIGCVTPAPTYNFTQEIAPQEGGIKFVRITEDADKVAGTFVQYSGSKIDWDAAPKFDIAPNGSMIGFLGLFNEEENIYLKSTSGGKAITQRTFQKNVGAISFSPDGNSMAFHDNTSGNYDVYLMQTNEGKAIRQITNSVADEYGPTFSPDGKFIFYTKTQLIGKDKYGNDSYEFYIWSFELSTSIETQYTRGFSPVIAPENKLLVTRNNATTGLGEIWIIDLKSGQETLVLRDQIKGFSSPDISSDGKIIVCVGSTPKNNNTPSNLDLYTVYTDGTNLTQLTFHGGIDVSPRWSPDDKSIYFISSRGSDIKKYNIWKIEYYN